MDIPALGALIVGSVLPVLLMVLVLLYLIVGALIVLGALIGAAIVRPRAEIEPEDATGLDELDRMFDRV